MGMILTQAVISVGGRGERLKPFTDSAPKPMIPILGKPLLEWQVMQFKKYGVTEIFLLLGYLPEVIKGYFGDGKKLGVTITYSTEDTPLGSIGSLKDIAQRLNDQFYFQYGDVFSLVDYDRMHEAFKGKKSPLCMQRVAKISAGITDVAVLDEAGRFTAIHPKADASTIEHAYRMRGICILRKEIASYIPEQAGSFSRDVLRAAVEAGEPVYGYECEDYSKGIDTMQTLREVEEHLRSS